MDIGFYLGLLSGMTGALMLNIGKAIQKQKVHVFLQGRGMFRDPHKKDLYAWLFGLLLTGGSSFPAILGIWLTGSSAVISALTGVGLVGLCIYAVRVIKEKMSALDIAGIILVMIGTSVMGYLGAEGAGKKVVGFSPGLLAMTVTGMCVIAAAGCLTALKFRRIHGIMFGFTAGLCIGTPFFLMHAGIVDAKDSLIQSLLTPYPYIAIVFALTATVVTQLGFMRARALEVVPAVNSSIVLVPVILEAIIYSKMPGPINIALICVILAGVLVLSMGSASKVQA
jgi:hypothetical protein